MKNEIENKEIEKDLLGFVIKRHKYEGWLWFACMIGVIITCLRGDMIALKLSLFTYFGVRISVMFYDTFTAKRG